MYAIERKPYGYRLTFSGFMQIEEMEQWLIDSKAVLASSPAAFGVFVDMRAMKPLPEGAQVSINFGQRVYKESGMQRSVLVYDHPMIQVQLQRISTESDIEANERYISARERADWEAAGLAWITEGIEPGE